VRCTAVSSVRPSASRLVIDLPAEGKRLRAPIHFESKGVIELKIFFRLILLVVLGVGLYLFRIREKLFGHKGDTSDSYASSNLRMWMVLLVWFHAVVILIAMIYRV